MLGKNKVFSCASFPGKWSIIKTAEEPIFRFSRKVDAVSMCSRGAASSCFSQATLRTRARSNCHPARPYMVRLTSLSRFT
jgi:hypothetical protein